VTAKRQTKKERAQIVASFHERILRRLKADNDVSIHQESYKSRYFRMFQEAYEGGFCHPLSYNLRYVPDGLRRPPEWIDGRPLVTGDSIWQYARKQGWVHSEMTCTEKRYKQIDTVATWWDEWIYAWVALMYKTRLHRTLGFETIYHNPALPAVVARKYVASENLAIFHKAGCKGGKISEEHVVHYATREEAIQAGKRPCRRCKP